MPPPTHSVIWTYFRPDSNDREKAQCIICYKTYSRKGRTTTSLKNHLKSMHPEQFRQFCFDAENQIQKWDHSGLAVFRTDTVNHVPPPETTLDARCSPPYNGNQQSAVDPVQFLDVSLPEIQNHNVDAKSNIVSNNKSESSSRSLQLSTSFVASSESVKLEKSSPKQSKRTLSLEGLKKLYFKKKCRNANLERKRILQEIAHAQEKHNLEMIILRRSLNRE